MSTIITLTGPTCSGKSTLEKKLSLKPGIGKLISFTTRMPREGEKDGIDYYFLKDVPYPDKCAELNLFNGNYYGVTIDQLEYQLSKYDKVILVADPNGVAQFKKICDKRELELFSVYLQHDIKTLFTRLLNRFKSDANSVSSNYAQRSVSMFSEWLTWPTAMEYDLVYENFGPGNEDWLINFLDKDLRND